MGQVYVHFSRVTDPKHLELIGLAFFLTCKHSHVICEMQQAYRPSTFSRTYAAPGSVRGLMWLNVFGGPPPSQTNGSTPRQRKGITAIA